MANMYDATRSTTSTAALSPAEPDSSDISHFLRQILIRSSPPCAFSPPAIIVPFKGKQTESFTVSENQAFPVRISGTNSSSGVVFTSPTGYFPASAAAAANVPSSSVGTIDNEAEEYDCESEEGFEALMEEAPAPALALSAAKPTHSSSKRSRAAEVHNMSEKRRRSRINEKMKALQNLIPNSNKTDKASMLDEAIEYLKQLQLQVQMLTLRNGLSLYPMCLPGVMQQPNQLSHMRMGSLEGNGSLDINMTSTLPLSQEALTNSMFCLPNQCANPDQPSVVNLPNIITSEVPFRLEPSIQAQCGHFQLHTSCEEICSENMVPHQQLDVDQSGTNSLEFNVGATATSPMPFNIQASGLKDNAMEACNRGRDLPEGLQLTTFESEPNNPPHLAGVYKRVASNDAIKSERLDF